MQKTWRPESKEKSKLNRKKKNYRKNPSGFREKENTKITY